MKHKIVMIILALAILSSCNIPQVTPDAVGTIVAATLTSAAPATTVPNINVLIGAKATPAPSPNPPAADQPDPNQLAPTQPPAPPEPTAIPTAVPTVSISGDEPSLRANRPFFIEGFENPNSSWAYDDEEFNLDPENNVLNLHSKGRPWWNSWFSTRPFFQDGYVEVEFRLTECQGDDRVGLVLRLVDNDFYFMGLECNGTWGFDRYTSEHRIVNIRAYEASTALGSIDQWNRIGVLAQGQNFSFYINGIKVGEASDASLEQEGRFGFISRASSTNAFLSQADNLGYWQLP